MPAARPRRRARRNPRRAAPAGRAAPACRPPLRIRKPARNLICIHHLCSVSGLSWLGGRGGGEDVGKCLTQRFRLLGRLRWIAPIAAAGAQTRPFAFVIGVALPIPLAAVDKTFTAAICAVVVVEIVVIVLWITHHPLPLSAIRACFLVMMFRLRENAAGCSASSQIKSSLSISARLAHSSACQTAIM